MLNENESLKEFYRYIAGKYKYRLRDVFLKKFLDRWCHFQYQGKSAEGGSASGRRVSGILYTFYQNGDLSGSKNSFEIYLRKVHIDGRYHRRRMSFQYQFITVDGKGAETVEDFIFGLFPKMCPSG